MNMESTIGTEYLRTLIGMDNAAVDADGIRAMLDEMMAEIEAALLEAAEETYWTTLVQMEV